MAYSQQWLAQCDIRSSCDSYHASCNPRYIHHYYCTLFYFQFRIIIINYWWRQFTTHFEINKRPIYTYWLVCRTTSTYLHTQYIGCLLSEKTSLSHRSVWKKKNIIKGISLKTQPLFSKRSMQRMSLSAFNRHTTGAPAMLINSSTDNMNLLKNWVFFLCKLLEENLCLFYSTVRMLDCRVVESVCLLTVKGEVEKVLWHPSSQFSLLVSQSFSQCRPTQIF